MPRLSRIQEESRRRITQLARSSVTPAQAGSELLAALSLAIPNDGQRLFGIDPATLLINRLVAASSNDDQARLEWLREYYLIERSIPFMQFPTLMRAELPVVSVHDCQERCWGVPGEMLYQLSPRDFYRAYHEGRTPVGGAVHVSLFAEGRWIAALQMYRRDARSPFRHSEVSFVHRLAPAMGRALAGAISRERALNCDHAGPDAPGVLILDPNQQVRYCSPAGETWNRLLRDTGRHGHEPLPTAIWSAVAGLHGGADGTGVASLTAQTPSGPLRVEASEGGEDGSLVVVLSPDRPLVRPEIPAGWPLTPRERSVADLVVSGLSNSEIAGRLFVSEKTVETHLGNVYEKTGVRGRYQLLARFFQTVYLPGMSDGYASEASERPSG